MLELWMSRNGSSITTIWSNFSIGNDMLVTRIWLFLNNFNCQYDIHYNPKTTQIWGLANMKYKTFQSCGCYVVVFVVVIDVFVPTSARLLLLLNEWFVQIYLIVNFVTCKKMAFKELCWLKPSLSEVQDNLNHQWTFVVAL